MEFGRKACRDEMLSAKDVNRFAENFDTNSVLRH